MRPSLPAAVLLLLSFLAGLLSAATPPGFEIESLDGAPVVADRVVLRLRPAARRALARPTSEGWRAALGLPAGVELQPDPFTRRAQTIGARPGSAGGGELDPTRPIIVELRQRMGIADALAFLRQDPRVEYAEPDGVVRAGLLPTDPGYGTQWHHPRIGMPAAWEITRGDARVIVAVVDTGIDPQSSEFAGRLLPGYNFVANNDDTRDVDGHGTGVATILAGNANNDFAGAGIDWNCRLLPVKCLTGTGFGSYSTMAAGIDFAVARGARVINLSSGGETESVTLENAIRNAVARGVVVVTITHNDGREGITFPGRMPECITVGASERDDRKASYSNWGPRVDLLAPGLGGTSSSAPQVAGAVALLLAVRPNLQPEEVRALLHAGAADQVGGPADLPGFDEFHGWGRLDVARSLALALAGAAASPRLINLSTRGKVGAGEEVLIAGLVLRGTGPKRVLVRAMGPSLRAAGVLGALTDPSLELVDAGGQRVAFNNDWAEAGADALTATGLAPADPREAALVATLPAGAYTVIVRGNGGATGIGLVEAYDLD